MYLESGSEMPLSANTDLRTSGQTVNREADRAEVTALLIRCGYRVYRPEADVASDDLILQSYNLALISVKIKHQPLVNWSRYGEREIWMLFPEKHFVPDIPRSWFLIPHDVFFNWTKVRYGKSQEWANCWSYENITGPLRAFLAEYNVRPSAETAFETKINQFKLSN